LSERKEGGRERGLLPEDGKKPRETVGGPIGKKEKIRAQRELSPLYNQLSLQNSRAYSKEGVEKQFFESCSRKKSNDRGTGEGERAPGRTREGDGQLEWRGGGRAIRDSVRRGKKSRQLLGKRKETSSSLRKRTIREEERT